MNALSSNLKSNVLGLSLLICASTLLWAWELSRGIFIIIGIYSLYITAKRKHSWQRDQYLFAVSILAFYFAALASYFVNDAPEKGFNIIVDKYPLLLLSIPLLHLISNRNINSQIFWGIFALGALSAGTLSMIDIFVHGQERATGTSQWVLFGIISAAFTYTLVSGYHYFNKTRTLKTFFIISLAFGASAVLLSGTRGIWLSVPLVAIGLFLFYFEHFSLRKKLVFIVIILVGLPAASYPIPFIKDRVDLAIDRATPYILGIKEKQSPGSSTGVRFEVWKESISIVKSHNLFGVGTGNFRNAIKQFANKDSKSYRYITKLKHAHNQYVHSLLTKGGLGLVALLSMQLAHFYLFSKYLTRKYSISIRSTALAGVMLTLSYGISGLTDVPFEQKITIITYSLFSALLLGRILFLNSNREAQLTTG